MSISQYIETVKQLSYAAPAYRSTVSINIGMTGSALKNFGNRGAETAMATAHCQRRNCLFRPDRTR
jgi:hypothetical protein